MRVAIVAQRETDTNRALAAAARGSVRFELMKPDEALQRVQPGEAALGRLDVLPTLDGVDDGLWALGSLAARGVRTLNRASALMVAHDKLLTARFLLRAGLPHPRTRLVQADDPAPKIDGPVVVKPRFGSWGRDVTLCKTPKRLRNHLTELRSRPWFRAHGALVQELVPNDGADLRIVVAGGVVVGAISRVAKQGEWRTNIALGAERRRVVPSMAACHLAVACADAAGAHLLGIDLLPDGTGGHTVSSSTERSSSRPSTPSTAIRCSGRRRAGTRRAAGHRPRRAAARRRTCRRRL